MEDKFAATVDLLQRTGYHRLLFIIDELDRVADTAGFANFLKNASSATAKFLLVGIGHNITSLLLDHESLVRSLVPVRLRPMKPDELDRILQKASRRLGTIGVVMAFSRGARDKIVATARGFPWFVHVLAQAALVKALDADDGTLAEHHIQGAIDDLASNTFAQHFADIYQEAVQGSIDREVMLRLMAKSPATDIVMKDVYALAEKLNVEEPAAWATQLLDEEFGRVVVCPRGQRRVFRFRNAMFKRYCDIRSSLHARVQNAVDVAWAASRE